MEQRTFDNVAVGEIGMGCWQLGGGDWGDVSDDEALATLQAARDSGVNFFDTADVYGGGRSESLVGRFRKSLGAAASEIFIATKLGRGGDPGGAANLTPATMRAHTEASLRRLGVDTLDLTQLHCIPTEALRVGEVFDTLRSLKEEGLIQRWGASVESVEEGLICLAQPGLASLQIIFNIFRQKPIDALFAEAKSKNVALIVRLPLASGLLTGKYKQDTTFAPSDHRTYNRNGEAFNVGETFAGLPFEEGVALTDALKPWVPVGWTLAQTALRWCLDYPEVTVLIPGAKNAAQAQGNAAVAKLPALPAELHAQLRAFYREHVADKIRGPY